MLRIIFVPSILSVVFPFVPTLDFDVLPLASRPPALGALALATFMEDFASISVEPIASILDTPVERGRLVGDAAGRAFGIGFNGFAMLETTVGLGGRGWRISNLRTT